MARARWGQQESALLGLAMHASSRKSPTLLHSTVYKLPVDRGDGVAQRQRMCMTVVSAWQRIKCLRLRARTPRDALPKTRGL